MSLKVPSLVKNHLSPTATSQEYLEKDQLLCKQHIGRGFQGRKASGCQNQRAKGFEQMKILCQKQIGHKFQGKGIIM
jgi:hypothetical protein